MLALSFVKTRQDTSEFLPIFILQSDSWKNEIPAGMWVIWHYFLRNLYSEFTIWWYTYVLDRVETKNIQIVYHSVFNFCFKNVLVTSTADFSYAEQSIHILNPLRRFPWGWKVECVDFALEAFFSSKNRPVSPRTPGCDVNDTALKRLTAPPATCAQFPQRCLSVIDNTLVNYVWLS